MKFETYSIQLTFGEVLWIGRIFGKNAFPFLFPYEKQPNLASMAGEIEQGRESLIKKGWARKNLNKTYTIDRLVYFLVDWLSQPEKVAVIDSISRIADSLHLAIHEKQGHYLFVEFVSEGIRLTLHKDRHSLLASLVGLFPVNSKTPESFGQRVFPILQPIELIRLAWKSREMASESLLVAGFQPEKTEEYLKSIDLIQTAGMISLFDYDKNETEPQEQGLFIFDSAGDWFGQCNGMDEMVVEMQPVDRTKMLDRFWM